MKFVKLPLCIEGFSSSNPHVDVARGGAVKGEDVMSFVDWWLVTGYVQQKRIKPPIIFIV